MNSTHPPLLLVSVITRTCPGRLEWLKKSVTSVLAQTYPAIELIIVEDGGSSAESFVKTLNAIYLSQEKQGRSAAGNRGLAAAKGEYIVFLDDDDLFLPSHVETLVTTLRHNPSYCAAYSVAGEFTDAENAEPKVVWRQKFFRKILENRNFLPIQAVMFKRALYEAKGGFDLNFDALEDWDLWLRYSQESDFIFVDQLTSLYRVTNSPKIAFHRKRIFFEMYPKVLEKHHIPYSRFNLRRVLNSILLSNYAFFYIYWLMK